MNRLTKKITICILSILFIFSSTVCLTLFTSNKAKATQTANFVKTLNSGVWSTGVWSSSHKTLFLQFDTALAPTTTSIQGNGTANSSGDVATNVTINGTTAIGSKINFYLNTFYQTEGTNTTVLEVLFTNYTTISTGDVLGIPEGTAFGDVTLSAVWLQFNGTAWVECEPNTLPSANYLGIADGYNMTSPTSGRYYLGLQFDKALSTADDSNLFDGGNTLNIYLDGVALSNGDFSPRCYHNIKDYTIMELLFKKGYGSAGTYATGVTLQNGTKLEIKDSTVNNYPLQDVTLYFNGETWQDTDPTIASCEGIATGYNMTSPATGRYYLGLQFDKALSTAESTDLFTSNTLNIYIDDYALSSSDSSYFAPRCYHNIKDYTIMELLFKSGYTYASGCTLKNGSKLEIKNSTVNGYKLQDVTLYFNGETWQEEAPAVSSTVTFTGVLSTQNNAAWEASSGFTATYLVFEGGDFATGVSYTTDGIYYTDANGNNATKFGFYWVNTAGVNGASANVNTIQLLYQGAPSIADGSILRVVGGTSFAGQILPDVTMYMVSGKWQTELSTGEPTVTFTGVHSNQNNQNYFWATIGGTTQYATYLTFSGDFVEGQTEYVNGGVVGTNGAEIYEGLYYTLPDDSTKYHFPTIWVTTAAVDSTGTNVDAKTIILMRGEGEGAIEDGATLYVEEGTEFGGQILPAVTLYMEDGKWVTEKSEPKPVTLEKIEWNGTGFGDYAGKSVILLKYSGTDEYSISNSDLDVIDILGGLITVNGTKISEMTNGKIMSYPSYGAPFLLIQYDASYATHGASLVIPADTVVKNAILPELTLYMNGESGLWQDTEPEPAQEVSFVSIEWNNAQPFGDNGYYMTALHFSSALYGPDDESADTLTYNNAKTLLNAISGSIKINGVDGNSLGLIFHGDSSGDINFQIPIANLPTLSSSCEQVLLTIDEGTIIGCSILPAITLYLNKAKQWQVEEYTYVPPQEVTFESIEWNNAQPFGDNGHYMTALHFSSALYGSDDDSAEVLTYSGAKALLNTIKANIKINGVDGNSLGLIFHGDSSGDINFQIPIANLPTLSSLCEQVILTIDAGTEIGDYLLPELTLYLNALNKWQLEECSYVPPQEVTFVEFDKSYNNGKYPWGDNRANVLYFDMPLYTEDIATARVENVYGDLASNMTINGLPATDYGIVITFDVLSEDGRKGLEFYFDTSNMPVFSQDLNQIVLRIEGGTKFLNNILPELTFYLNDYEEWQTEEYIYEYAPPKEISIAGISADYNNYDNPWRDGYYLTRFDFDDYLAKKAVSDGAWLIGEKILINGKTASELGFLFSTNAYTMNMNVQYPKEVITELMSQYSRVILELTEPVEFGSVIIKPFRLYLNEYVLWQVIDETDKTPPVITYDGPLEITTSAEKPFVIEVSAFDYEDNLSSEITYNWSNGALDSKGNLRVGTHTCEVVAMDIAGNTATLTLTVNVGEKATNPPVINVSSALTAYVGIQPDFVFEAEDEFDKVICVITWSEGALDADGKLTEGTHIMTLTATNLTGLTTTKDVTVTVVNATVEELLGGAEVVQEGCKDSAEGSSIILFGVLLALSLVIFVKRKSNKHN